jgi:hypothetical protein
VLTTPLAGVAGVELAGSVLGVALRTEDHRGRDFVQIVVECELSFTPENELNREGGCLTTALRALDNGFKARGGSDAHADLLPAQRGIETPTGPGCGSDAQRGGTPWSPTNPSSPCTELSLWASRPAKPASGRD